MITAVRIKNLRSLADTGFIEIKPLTLLLGANSSGKSTFLRSFPLFTQSVNKNLRGPISWFDDSLVDFGDYNTAINKFAERGETIQFEYKIKFDTNRRFYNHSFRKQHYRFIIDSNDAFFSFSLKNDSKGTFIDSTIFKIAGFSVKIQTPDRQDKVIFEINNQIVETELPIRTESMSYNSILPSLLFIKKDGHDHIARRPVHEAINDNIYSFVKNLSDRRLRDFSKVDSIIDAWSINKDYYLSWLKESAPITSFRNHINNWTTDNAGFNELYNLVSLKMLLPLCDLFDEELSMFYSNCSYIAPTRAEANRYYRTQGLQVSDIDSYGKNLAEFISSLTQFMLHSYNDYTNKVLGVGVKTKAEAGHQCIMISSKNGDFNISDVGFGYSQILPIITKLWYSSKRGLINRRFSSPREGNDSVILMEQPELHLHPAYQALIADAFINSVKKEDEQDTSLRMIAETHSDTILNRIGRRVREGKISPDDVNIVLFEKGLDDTITKIKQTTYNAKGQIMEWPYGFFDPLEE